VDREWVHRGRPRVSTTGPYVFQITDPSGKKLLSTDPAGCRQFTVVNGLITGVAPSGGCAHVTFAATSTTTP
jgi:hypothetical protein